MLAARRLPVLILWSDADRLIPVAAFDTFCSAFGTEGHVVSGGHSWLLANPDVFGEVLDNVIHVEGQRARRTGGHHERRRGPSPPRRDVPAAGDGRVGCWTACRRCGRSVRPPTCSPPTSSCATRECDPARSAPSLASCRTASASA